MITNQRHEDFPEVQAAIYRVALSMDAFLLNGIPYGVIHRPFFDGFVEKTAGHLLGELESLENQVGHGPDTTRHRTREALGALRDKCQELIAVVSGLVSFRNLPLQPLCSIVSRIPSLRGECVQLIQELESCLRTSKPFYQSRPSHSTAAMNDFLSNLERIFTEEWHAANAGLQESAASGSTGIDR